VDYLPRISWCLRSRKRSGLLKFCLVFVSLNMFGLSNPARTLECSHHHQLIASWSSCPPIIGLKAVGVRRVSSEHQARYLRARARLVQIQSGDAAALTQLMNFLRRHQSRMRPKFVQLDSASHTCIANCPEPPMAPVLMREASWNRLARILVRSRRSRMISQPIPHPSGRSCDQSHS
jgi:hypothetical protein